MRTRWSLPLLSLATALGCGDGVGRPIVEGEPAAAGTAGSALSGSPGSTPLETGGSGGVTAGSSGAGTGGSTGGVDVAGGGGGAERPEGGDDDSGPPWNGGGTNGGGMGGWGGRADWGGSNWGESGEMGEFGPVPPGEHCANAADWDGGAADAEQKLLEVLNFARERGEPCESNTGEAAPPLAMRAELRCAARLHSLDMVERDFFDHTNPDGTGPEERIRETGYSFRVASESICCEISESSGMDPYDMAPYDALAELFDAGGNDCKNLVDPWFDAVGIGYFGGYWTLDFAGP